MEVPVQIGEVLASKYRVERVLGAGGMGVVVAARHMHLGSLVALKFLLPDVLHVPVAVDRFSREARAVARLRGEHVVRVSDFGTLEMGAPYIVMEFLEGSDLEAVLQERGPLAIADTVGYALDVCSAMDEAHQSGIVHRDLKPTNLFLTCRHDGTPLIKVLDFGIAKLAEDAVSATRTGSLLGSPAFMAPEQIKHAKHVDARADIYSLGVVIYYLLTRRHPHEAKSVGELFGRVLYQEPLPLRCLRPDVPATLEAIVTRCLQKDPNARFQHAKDLRIALCAALAPPSDMPRAVPSLASAEGDAPPAPEAQDKPRRARTLVALAGGLSLLAALAVIVGIALLHKIRSTDQRNSESAPPVATSPSVEASHIEPQVSDSRSEDAAPLVPLARPSASTETQTPAAARAPRTETSLADRARASMLKDPTAARHLLEPRLGTGRMTHEELSLLRAICKYQKDSDCLRRCTQEETRFASKPK